MNRLSKEIRVTAIVKGNERYVLLYDEATLPQAMWTLARWASNPELSFSWYDAACASQRMRDRECEGK